METILDQTLINYLMAGFGAAISFILKVIWEGLQGTPEMRPGHHVEDQPDTTSGCR
jgi:hypothetical protein